MLYQECDDTVVGEAQLKEQTSRLGLHTIRQDKPMGICAMLLKRLLGYSYRDLSVQFAQCPLYR
jgi:hypothetical protein